MKTRDREAPQNEEAEKISSEESFFEDIGVWETLIFS